MRHWLDGPLLGFDLETTAADPFEALPVSWALALRRDSSRMSIQGGLVNPGVPIPPDATEIHHITDEMVQADGIPLRLFAEQIKEKLLWAERERIPLVTMNGSYDLTIVHRLADLSDWHGCVIDILTIDKAVYKYRKGSRRLNRALLDEYGVEAPKSLGEGHQAAPDAVNAILVFLAMCDRYGWLPKRSPESLHTSQIHWYRGQQASLSEHFVEQGKDPIPEHERDWPIKVRPPQGDLCSMGDD